VLATVSICSKAKGQKGVKRQGRGHSAKKLALIIYTMQACVPENMGFRNMDYPIQASARQHNAIWSAYNQRGKTRKFPGSLRAGREAEKETGNVATIEH
jgi:hypothetical protein